MNFFRSETVSPMVGKRVRLIHMEDPEPIPAGTMGTIVGEPGRIPNEVGQRKNPHSYPRRRSLGGSGGVKIKKGSSVYLKPTNLDIGC